MTPRDPAASTGPIHVGTLALQERLTAIFPAKLFQHELLPAPPTAQTLPKFLSSIRAPLVGLAWLGIGPADASGRVLDSHIRWGVYLVTRNPIQTGRVLGDSQGPGLIQMTHAAILGTQGWVIGGAGDGGVGTLELQGIETIDGANFDRADIACAAMTVRVRTSFTSRVPDLLKTIAAQWTQDGETTAATDTWKAKE